MNSFKRLKTRILIISTLLFSLTNIVAQGKEFHSIEIVLSDKSNNSPLEFANILIKSTNKSEQYSQGSITDLKGKATFTSLKTGVYSISISFIGYKSLEQNITVNKDTKFTFALTPEAVNMNEVVVTASESKGITSASKIDRKAMEHLQPSSFSDIVAMLPGGVINDPKMSEANFIKIREAGGSSKGVNNYNMSSLGTSFVIDGIPQLTNADMQYEGNSWEGTRSSTGKGVDMRAVSTDDIGSVEIVRGIPSVEYGELTSGLVNISRKKGGNRLDARFKADMQSQLFYAGKGFEMDDKDMRLNFGIDYLDAKDDPRDGSTNYKRVTFSARGEKMWNRKNYNLSLNSSINYTGRFEKEVNDPNLTMNGTVNEWISNNNKIDINNTLSLISNKNTMLKNIKLATSLSLEKSNLHQMKTVSTDRVYGVPTLIGSGEYDAEYMPSSYLATMDTKGMPLYIFTKLTSLFMKKIGNTENLLRVGLEWNMEKNYGDGKVYDISRPLSPGSSLRPRSFNSIPANHIASFFLEDETEITAGKHELKFRAGLRGNSLLGLDKKYSMSGKWYIDPRVNFQWNMPEFKIAGKGANLSFSAGAGMHTKMPVLAYLYPDKFYYDLVQLNYYHNNPEYRRLNIVTYEVDKTNYNLKAARNFKWEVRGDIAYQGHNLSVTYFTENMNSGFLNTRFYNIYDYKKYDASGVDHSSITSAPDISTLPYSNEKIINTTETITNGGKMKKSGIEFQYSSPRINALHTRLTVNGAWMRSKYDNGMVNYYKPSVIINNAPINYVGVYNENKGYLRESFNTNFIFDTYLEKLKLGFSTQFQCIWFTASQSLFESGIPTAYIGTDGVVRPFTEESMNDAVLKQLVVKYSDQYFDRQSVPFEMGINFRTTKSIWKDKIVLALYVNKILNYAPDYTRYATTVRRTSSPYFGMELNFKL